MKERYINISTELGDIKIIDNKHVYKPSDDTLLIIKAMLYLKNKGYVFERIIDIGTGSGILSIAAQKIFNPKVLISIDISPYAVMAAKKVIEMENKGNSIVIRCDGTFCLRGLYDLSIVNPPYLPSNDKIDDEWIVKSWQEENNHEKVCLSSLKSKNILILKSSLSKFDQDKCLKNFNYNKQTILKENLFMEQLEVNFWQRN
ncbi:Ribosomal protein L11 methyltransferase (PrmA) [Caldisphaera lagunensis DSM 15908]|uniref:Ribosomal protein L11 methyltransferase (PrmA) n=1 Tax=Caldisphaera lagunensis (strain DSM 15908 / JCM 11604 / ANMR 0165 / IC-154) TaxID=1056495 RepID=L0AAZ7_CALLD|nr:50S ribosomal protein L11 methyltransferase [Caldisphaera lagunensis]AFZ71051.1 Ribosomal protein L11 methyltransferase (PrmA) [Caldisphaera lagunensis DSM 15908]